MTILSTKIKCQNVLKLIIWKIIRIFCNEASVFTHCQNKFRLLRKKIAQRKYNIDVVKIVSYEKRNKKNDAFSEFQLHEDLPRN